MAKTKATRRSDSASKPAAVKPPPRSKPEHGTSLMTAFREIRELIVHGRLSPGTWILEAELAERLNLSRTPVRGAIQWLQREGYILEHRNVRKSRMIVSPLTKEDSVELYGIIGRLEGMAGRGVATSPPATRQALCRHLRTLNRRLLAIADEHSTHPGEIFEIDRDFHRSILKAGAGPRLATLHKAVEPQVERYWRLYASSILGNLHLSVEEHDAIIHSISIGLAEETEAALQNNWSKGAERLGHVIDIFGERGSW